MVCELGKGKKIEESSLCPYYRIPAAKSNEMIKRLNRLMENGSAGAFHTLADHYYNGTIVPQDVGKAHELYLKAGELGYSGAYHNLGLDYDFGTLTVEIDKKKYAIKV